MLTEALSISESINKLKRTINSASEKYKIEYFHLKLQDNKAIYFEAIF